MNWFVCGIAWDTDYQANYPSEIFISWEHGITTKEDAIDFASDLHNEVILYATVIEE